MWFLGFSTNNQKNFLIFGAVLLVILLTHLVKKTAVYWVSRSSCAEEAAQKQKQRSKASGCGLCCRGVIRTYGVEELRRATKNFGVHIGVGATSVVYLAELGDGKLGAVKRVMEERGGSKKMFLDEVSVLLRISHPNLVGLLGFCMEKGEQLLLLECVPKGSLFERMHTNAGQSSGILTWANRLNIALDIARALHYLHSEADPPVIHRDVKSSNILLVDDDHAKLADFGLCKLGHDASPTSIKGSFGYIDVEYLETGSVSRKSDVYSYGVLLLELITGLKSMQGSVALAEWTEDLRKRDEFDVSMVDPKLKGEVDLEQVREMGRLANLALVRNSQSRPDMSEIVDRILACLESQHRVTELPV